jgi:hypothetical protein
MNDYYFWHPASVIKCTKKDAKSNFKSIIAREALITFHSYIQDMLLEWSVMLIIVFKI